MNITRLIPVLAALAVGLGLGWIIRGAPSIDENASESADSSSRFRQGGGQPDGAPSRSTRTPSADRREEFAEDDDLDESLRVDPDQVVRLIGSKVAPLEERAQLVRSDQPLEQVIGVTDDEAEKLNKFWNRLRPALDSLRADHVIHQEFKDGGIWFGVEPFPEEGESLRQDFLVTAIKTLGEARSRVFLNAISAHRAFGQWGKSVGSGFSVHTFVQDDKSLIYEIYEDSPTAGKPGRKWNSSTIPPHLKKLVQSSHADLPGIK